MKLYLKLHATAELLTEQSAADCAALMQTAIGTRFQGREGQDGWALLHIDRNLFRPALFLKFVPDADGTLLWADYKPDRMLLLFMCIWSAVVLAVAAWKGWLLLVMLPVFWAVMIVGFSAGVRRANQALLEVFSANEVVE